MNVYRACNKHKTNLLIIKLFNMSQGHFNFHVKITCIAGQNSQHASGLQEW